MAFGTHRAREICQSDGIDKVGNVYPIHVSDR